MRKLKNSIETIRDNRDSDVIQQEFSKSGQKKGISPFAGERNKIFEFCFLYKNSVTNLFFLTKNQKKLQSGTLFKLIKH